MENVFLAQSNMVKCECGNIMELVEGDVDYNAKDDDGNKISKEAAVHMSKYRIRCSDSKCNKIFCSTCKIEPYHVGKTCDQHAEYAQADKCRFCLIKLKGPRKGVKPAF